jgi:hypothetical protein
MPIAGRSRFFIWHLGGTTAEEFEPQRLFESDRRAAFRYYYGVARELERLGAEEGTTFLFTWQLDAFEERFRDAVVILIGDEKHQVPSYAGRARAIFKTGGTKRTPRGAMVRLAPAVAWRTAVRELRNAGISRRRGSPRWEPARTPMFEIPIGDYGMPEVPFVPFAQRTVDVFFAGSIQSERGFTLRPRLLARRQMASGLEAARRRLLTLNVDFTCAGAFANPADMLDPLTYATRLMQARIVLCPRGNFDETFRLTEAAKSGCVAVVERLPDRWYYRGSPAIQIDRWKSLPETLAALLANPSQLERRSEHMRRWWEGSISERPVAQFILSTLRGLDRTEP